MGNVEKINPNPYSPPSDLGEVEDAVPAFDYAPVSAAPVWAQREGYWGLGFFFGLIFVLVIAVMVFGVSQAKPAPTPLFPVVLGCFFAIISGSGVAWSVIGLRRIYREDKLVSEEPRRPWLWRSDWRSGVVRHRNGTEVAMLAAAVFFWDGLLCFFYIPAILNFNVWALLLCIAIGSPLIFVGGWLVSALVKSIVTFFYWGTSELRMTQTPIPVGGQLDGIVHLSRSCHFDAEFQVTLRCTELWGMLAIIPKRPAEYRTHAEFKTSVSQTKDRDGINETKIPISFAIPPDAPGLKPGKSIRWQLAIESENTHRPFQAEFDIPVFHITRKR